MAVREFKLLSCGHRIHMEGFMSSLNLQETRKKHLEPLFLAFLGFSVHSVHTVSVQTQHGPFRITLE